jgi:biotin transport system substrate-specific component
MEVILRKEIIVDKTLCRALGVAVFVVLTSLGGFVRIPLPFTPVPLTLQTFFVLLGAAFLGSRLGVFTQLSYLLLGVMGLPIFSGAGSGMLYLFGPTGGYLAGFVLASIFIGRFIRQAQGLASVFAVFCLADFILLVSGLIWLKLILGYPLSRLLVIGFLPFVPGDLVKVFIASGIYLSLRQRVKEIF